MQQVSLAPPGAGLPFFEALYVRYWLAPRFSRKHSNGENLIRFLRESEKILGLTENLLAGRAEERVLIDRIPGLEDSSRFWSVHMTLEHLIIVSRGMANIATLLDQGQAPSHFVRTELVKPAGQLSWIDTLSEFKKMIIEVPKQLEFIKERSKLAHEHPWFGPLDAGQWIWILATHQGLHRKQVKEILSRI